MLKRVSILSLFVLLFPFLSPITIYAEDINSAKSNDISNNINSGSTYSETFEANGVTYFYEDTLTYTIVITDSINGEQTISFNDKTQKNDEILYTLSKQGFNSNNKQISKQSSSDKDPNSIQEIKKNFFNGQINVERIDLDSISVSIPPNDNNFFEINSAGLTGASAVNREMQKRYGSTFTYRYLTQLTRNGRTGTLYQHRTYGAIPEASRLFNTLTTIGIIASAFSTPASSLVALASWTSAAGSAYQLARSTTFTEWKATVYLQKLVKVGSIYPYRSYYDRHHKAITGSSGAYVDPQIVRTYKNSDYDNNTSILITGINLAR